jgi:hypothetical protein
MTPLPDDPAALVERAQDALTTPGCLDITAEVHQRAGLPVAQSERRWAVSGRLVEGEWTALEWTPTLDPPGGVTMSFGVGSWSLPFMPPMFSVFTVGEDGGLFGEAQDLFSGFTSVVEGEVSTIYAEVDADKVVLTRLFDQGRLRANRGTVTFERESLRPRAYHLLVERPIETDSMGKLTDLDVEILLGPGGHPTSERLYGQGRAGPMRLRVTREIVYTSARPCVASP